MGRRSSLRADLRDEGVSGSLILMMRRVIVVGLALAFGLLGVGVLPATADEFITPGPTAQPGDPFGGKTVPPGPIFIITPGSTATALPSPSDPEDVQEQIKQDQQPAASASPTAAGSAGPGAPATGQISPSAAPEDSAGGETGTSTSASDSSSTSAWWLAAVVALGASALVGVLVIARRRRDRTRLESLNEHAP